jgi:biotin carboxyl carrier protein
MSPRTQWKDGDRVREVELSALGPDRWRVSVDGVPFEVSVRASGPGWLVLGSDGTHVRAEVTAVGERRFVRLDRADFVLKREASGRRRTSGATQGSLEAPMPGVVTKVLVAAGDRVAKGQPLVAVEAMKMEHLIRAPRDGTVRAIQARQGEMVDGGVTLVEMEPVS